MGDAAGFMQTYRLGVRDDERTGISTPKLLLVFPLHGILALEKVAVLHGDAEDHVVRLERIVPARIDGPGRALGHGNAHLVLPEQCAVGVSRHKKCGPPNAIHDP